MSHDHSATRADNSSPHQSAKTTRQRLLTFSSCQSAVISALSLAKAGFCFKIADNGQEVVECRWCDLMLELSSLEGEDPLALHQTYSNGICQFVKEKNEEIEESQTFGSDGHSSSDMEGVAGPASAAVLTAKEKLNQPFFPSAQLEDKLSLYSYFKSQNLPDLSPPAQYPHDMKYESSRASSFKSLKLPDDLSVTLLAAQGLYLSDIKCEDNVACAFCQIRLPLNAQTVTEHRKLSPNCSLLRGGSDSKLDNIPDIFSGHFNGVNFEHSSYYNQLGINKASADCPELAVESRRAQSFLTYPYSEQTLSDRENLCEAGYYYQGGEVVKCFWCGCESTGLKSGEDAWTRHARTSPTCQFVVMQKGNTFIQTVLDQYGPYVPPPTSTTAGDERLQARHIRPRMHTNCVQKALQLGMDRESVLTVVRRRIIQKKQDFKNVSEIVREVNEAVAAQRTILKSLPTLPAALRPPTVPQQDVIEFTEEPEVMEVQETRQHAKGADEVDASVANSKQLNSLEMPIKELRSAALEKKQQLTCKVCMSEIVGISFLPCGHLATCISCSAPVQQCPICRSDIKGTVRVVFPDH